MNRFSVLIFVFLATVACKTTAPIVTPTVHTDSVRTSNTHDSIRVYERDSVFVMYKQATGNRLQATGDRRQATGDRRLATGCCDTLYLEKWHTRYRDREVAVHDTIYQTQKETKVVQVKYTPPFYKVCTGSFLVLVLLFVIILVIRCSTIALRAHTTPYRRRCAGRG